MVVNYFNSPEGRRVGGIYLLSIPIIGPLYKNVYYSVLETSATLIRGGIPIVTAFQVAEVRLVIMFIIK